MASGDRLGASAPLVLTLELDGRAFAALDALRRRFYPTERNAVPAHVTLFHQLPGEHAREVKALLSMAAAAQRPIELMGAEAREINRGVAVFFRSPQLLSLRDGLAQEWWPWLTEQDRAGFRPHITIQSGVSRSQARATLREVGSAIQSLRRMQGTGVHLWRYIGPGWEDVRLVRFRGD
jgi:2'-5' RNA ligase